MSEIDDLVEAMRAAYTASQQAGARSELARGAWVAAQLESEKAGAAAIEAKRALLAAVLKPIGLMIP